MNKVEKARQDGMAYAYHVLLRAEDLESGMAELKTRLTRNQQTICPSMVDDKTIQEFVAGTKESIMTAVVAITLTVLEDKYHWDQEQMANYLEEYMEFADTIYGKFANWDDILAYFRDEYGIDISKRITEAEKVLSDMENRLEKRTTFAGEGAQNE